MNDQPFELPLIIIPIFFLVLFPAMWLIVLSVLARIGGWHGLAQIYPLTRSFQGKTWSLESAMLNSVRYKSSLVVGANWEGLYLSPIFLFRVGHSPLFIPWSEISVKPANAIFFWHSELHFQQASRTSLKISKRLTNRLATAAGDNWPATNPSQER